MDDRGPWAELQQWYAAQCDGLWEHEFGIEIDTLDNPGWTLVVDLSGTTAEGRAFDAVQRERSANDWVHARVVHEHGSRSRRTRFEGACGPENLSELVSTFVQWTRSRSADPETPAPTARVEVRNARPQDDIRSVLSERWGGDMVVHGRVFSLPDLPALVATDGPDVVGVLTYELRPGDVEQPGELEIVSCDSLRPRRGVGRALVEAACALAAESGADRVVCTTTNDNVGALAFWQRLGFRLVALRPGAVDTARDRKPAIPRIGEQGIEIHDELDLARPLPRVGSPTGGGAR